MDIFTNHPNNIPTSGSGIGADGYVGTSMLTHCSPGLRIVLVRNIATGNELHQNSDGTWSIPRNDVSISNKGYQTAQAIRKGLFGVASLPGVEWSRQGKMHSIEKWTVSLADDKRAYATWDCVKNTNTSSDNVNYSTLDFEQCVSWKNVLPDYMQHDAPFTCDVLQKIAQHWNYTQSKSENPMHLGIVHVTTATGIERFLHELGIVTPPTVRIGASLGSATILTMNADGQVIVHTIGDMSHLVVDEGYGALTQIWNNAP